MAKTAFVTVLSLVLLLSISRTVVGTENQAETIYNQMNQAASQVKETMESVSNSLGNKMEEAKETTSSWTGWFNHVLQNMGLGSGNHQSKAAAGPGPAPAPTPIAAGPRAIRF
ncbi:unnamed protein product [Dovyalis caffra]|uniref:Uncharacterized protein n=1 Tax=Dovyalis caffra TaxID=77055 RepID=A0AAV1S7Z4_9ROSI|nr:unnamed protein product [Dovyalis caffra]